MSIKLHIITPTFSRSVDIEQLEIETLKGQLTLLPGHEPAYIIVKEGSDVRWTISSNSKEADHIIVSQAILEVQRDSLTLITNSIEQQK